MRTVQPPQQNAPASFAPAPSWTPEPQRAPAPPQPSYPQEPARPTYEEMVERERRAALNRGPQEPRPFEPEPQEPEIDPFATDELQRYLATETEEPQQPFSDQPYELEAAFEEAEDASFETQDAFDSQDAFEAPEVFDAQDAFETDAEPQLFPAEEEPATAAFDAEFSPYSDLDDEEEEPTPSYGDAFGHEPQPQDLDANSGAGSRQMKPFEARYDQHPEITLGEYPQQPQQDGDASFEEAFFAGDQGDAELGDAEAEGKPRSRRKMMLAASLVGALAIGGALAYFYKGDSIGVASSGEPPLITADQRPVKTTPTDPGGKTFPHKNKLIYDRLQGEEPTEQERLVSRQEDVASTGSGQTNAAQPESAGGQQVASANQTASDAQAGAEPSASRRVRTFVVLPDGSVVKPEDNNQAPAAAAAAQPEAPSQPASIPGLAVANVPARSAGQPTAAAPSQPAPAAEAQQPAAQPQQQFASVQSPSAPVAPVRKPSPPPVQQQAAVQPAPAKPAPQTTASTSAGGSYVVQVAARKSQTDALAAFADLQQRYPQLLSGYRPIIERADLGAKGVWYRLRVGPMDTKTVASNLCGKLQAAGMKECLIYSQ